MEQVLERLAAAGIQLAPATELRGHFLFEREGFLVLVERTAGGFGSVGNPGILTEKGFAVLVRRGSRFAFVAKGFEVEASKEQVSAARRLTEDLRRALAG